MLRARDAEALPIDSEPLSRLLNAAMNNATGGEIRRLIAAVVPEFAGGHGSTGDFELRIVAGDAPPAPAPAVARVSHGAAERALRR